MIEWLFLDRIDAEAARAAVGGQDDLVIASAAHETQAALAVTQFAKTRAQVALQSTIVESVPVTA